MHNTHVLRLSTSRLVQDPSVTSRNPSREKTWVQRLHVVIVLLLKESSPEESRDSGAEALRTNRRSRTVR